ncbi:MAG: hydantoinase/oxoprolinase family protein, partial [Anaerolineae bacterium]|nr:hydantoinase/oxoprolinase family protein [Anaerolineae bacterium]
AQHDLSQEGIPEEAMFFKGTLDMRYQGQSYELTLPMDGSLVDNFHQTHAEIYGHALPDRAVEIVNVRLQAIGTVEKPTFSPEPLISNNGTSAKIGEKMVYFRQGETTIPLYDREKLIPGAAFIGPALIFQLDSTTFVPPYWHIHVDSYHNLILESGR